MQYREPPGKTGRLNMYATYVTKVKPKQKPKQSKSILISSEIFPIKFAMSYTYYNEHNYNSYVMYTSINQKLNLLSCGDKQVISLVCERNHKCHPSALLLGLQSTQGFLAPNIPHHHAETTHSRYNPFCINHHAGTIPSSYNPPSQHFAETTTHITTLSSFTNILKIHSYVTTLMLKTHTKIGEKSGFYLPSNGSGQLDQRQGITSHNPLHLMRQGIKLLPITPSTQ